LQNIAETERYGWWYESERFSAEKFRRDSMRRNKENGTSRQSGQPIRVAARPFGQIRDRTFFRVVFDFNDGTAVKNFVESFLRQTLSEAGRSAS
jgi:hypothetical protein